MKLHQQFDLNLKALKIDDINDIPRRINETPVLVEKLIKDLLEKGYEVVKEGAHFTGVPQSITLVKEFTGPFVARFSIKAKEDIDSISRSLGIERLFE